MIYFIKRLLLLVLFFLAMAFSETLEINLSTPENTLKTYYAYKKGLQDIELHRQMQHIASFNIDSITEVTSANMNDFEIFRNIPSILKNRFADRLYEKDLYINVTDYHYGHNRYSYYILRKVGYNWRIVYEGEFLD